MRTIKRQSLVLNASKLQSLKDLTKAYTAEKQYWLRELQSFKMQASLGNYRLLRNELIKNGYKSAYGLQARHWKLALQDAVETWDKYFQALFVKIRAKIFKLKASDVERHYAFFLLADYERFIQVIKGKIPKAPFSICALSCKRLAGYIKNLFKKLKGKSPRIKKTKTIKFDADCYNIFEHEGRQYVKIMSLVKGKRLIVPLKGRTKIEGNITLVLKDNEVSVHVAQELKTKTKPLKNIEAVDFGYTEVMTDSEGARYGQQFGKLITQTSDRLKEKMQKRHRLHALKEKKPHQAKMLLKNNLGTKKLKQKKQKTSATLTREINQAINQLIKTKKPSLLITEDLSHLFTFGKIKNVNRRLSSWLRGEITNRVSFKALAEGFRHSQVNSAYSSQICPLCDFVDSKNRRGDKFVCLHCRHEALSDVIAAKNLAKRYEDKEISLYTPYSAVKAIHLARFHRRLEEGQLSTVPGRTLDTVSDVHPPHAVEAIAIAGREKSRLTGRSIRERNKK